MKTKKNETGFTLIEVIIALFIFSVGIIGVLAMKSNAVMNNALSKQQTVASELCVSAVERFMMCDFWIDPANSSQNSGDALINVTSGYTTVDSEGEDDFNIKYKTPYIVRYRVEEPTANFRRVTVAVDWPGHTGNRAMIMEYVIPRDAKDI